MHLFFVASICFGVSIPKDRDVKVGAVDSLSESEGVQQDEPVQQLDLPTIIRKTFYFLNLAGRDGQPGKLFSEQTRTNINPLQQYAQI